MDDRFAGLSHMYMRRLRQPLAFMAISILFISCGSPDQQDKMLHPTTRLVTMDVKNAPLAAVLTAIGQQARITISVPDNIPSERLSLSFQNIPLEEALKRVLVGQSYTFAYTQNKGREVIAGVRLFAKHEQIPLTGSAPSSVPAIAQLTGR